MLCEGANPLRIDRYDDVEKRFTREEAGGLRYSVGNVGLLFQAYSRRETCISSSSDSRVYA